MELLVRLAALCLCVSAVTALLKKSEEALALLLLLAAVLVGCALLLPTLSDLADFCTRTLALTGLPAALFAPRFYVLGHGRGVGFYRGRGGAAGARARAAAPRRHKQPV